MHTVSSQRLSPKGRERQFRGMKVPTALSANKGQEASSIFNKEQEASSIFNKEQEASSIFNKEQEASSTFNKEQEASSIFNKEQEASSIFNKEQEASSTFDKAVSNFHGSAAAPMIRQGASAMVGFQSTAVPATNQNHESQKVSCLFGFLLISFFDLPWHCATACVHVRFSIVCSPIELRQKGKDGAKMGSATRPFFPVSGRL